MKTRVLLVCWFLAGCSVYDAVQLVPGKDASDGTVGDGAIVDMGHLPQAGTMGVDRPDAGAALDAGRDGSTGAVHAGCHANPNQENEVCTQICPEVCDGQDNDCDLLIDEDTANDCAAAHANTLCTAGKCVVANCLDAFRDCNGIASDGCEVAASDPNNCGLCNHVCTLVHATAQCVSGACKVAQCAAGYGDCDGDGTSCETSLSTLKDCGGCASQGDNDACLSLPNATTDCGHGRCEVATCIGDFADCDHDTVSCETELNSNAHCGGCTQSCSFLGSQTSCATGSCLATGCDAGFAECDGAQSDGCESLSSATNCGACGKRCGPDPDPSVHNHVSSAQCTNQVCKVTQCETHFADCDGDPFNGCETDLRTEQNCGDCGVSCDSSDFANADVSCASGVCSFVSCKNGFGDCGGGTADGCETALLNAPAHCGSCGKICGAGEFCVGGKCSLLDCTTAPHNNDCGGATCADCNADGTSCETDVASLSNCLACGNACAFNAGPTPIGTLVCKASGCGVSCPPGYGDCDGDYRNGCERSLATLANCGTCGMGCSIANATASCATGSCRVQQCASDFADCDSDGVSCETSLAATATCGACNVACSVPNAVAVCGGVPGARSCGVGACSQSYYKDCSGGATDGCEVDSRTDAANCGGCGNNCQVQPNVGAVHCASSACVIDSCASGWADCTAAVGCETHANTVQNCGACANNCDLALAHTSATSCDSATLTCKVGTCSAGFADCDGTAANGCETSLHTVTDCGGCSSLAQNVACSGLPNVAQSACGAGTCTIQSCAPGFLDCDQVVANGCERNGNTQGPCTPDTSCVQKSYGGNTYFFCQNDSTWLAARDKCRLQQGGDLVSIGSSGENSFVQSNLVASSNAWLGANDLGIEGQFAWSSDAVPFWKNGASVLAGYANWNTAEPNGGASDDCVELYASGTPAGKWSDTTCTTLKDFVCEVSADECPSDASKWHPGQCGCGNAETDADADGFAVCNDACDHDGNKVVAGVCGCGASEASCGPGGDCTFKSYAGMSSTGYYVCTLPRAWADARNVCQQIPGAELVHVDDASEDTFVKQSIASQAWIGANDLAAEGQWRWSNDNSLFWSGNGSGSAQGGRYAHWSTTAAQPNDGANADCGTWWLSNGAGWSDESCASTYGFMCEVPADQCPSSPKFVPGQCGCALADTDSDLDGVADCNDACPSDPQLSVAGQCGCPSQHVADGTLCSDGLCAANTQCNAGRCGTIEQCYAESSNISVGSYHACARSAAGKAYCWGTNGQGELGDGTVTERRGPVEVQGLSDVREIATGDSQSCAIVGSGELYCWGNGAGSRLGNGSTAEQHVPTKVSGITTATHLALGAAHGCVVLASGGVKCWGTGASGRLGNGTTSDQATPAAVSNLSDAVQVAAGADFSCALRSGGTLVCWGNAGSGRLGNNNAVTMQVTPVAVQNLSNVVQVTAGTTHACAIVSGGQAYCWGSGANGRLGNNAQTDQLVPGPVSGLSDALQIDAGDNFSCAVRSNGAAVCWGYNANGRLGTSTPAQSLVPIAVTAGYTFTRISAGLNSTCGLSADGSAHCFGYGVYGLNGDGTNVDRQAPNVVSPAFHAAQGIAAGYLHTCAIDSGGALRCFGYNGYSQLGDATTSDRWTPIPATLPNVKQTSVGEYQSCALTNAGDIYCWGINTSGRLGVGDANQRSTPTKVTLGAVATAVSTGFDTSCALLQGGQIACWGLGDHGQLGNAANLTLYVPVAVFGISTAVAVAAGYRHTCALLADGTVKCWGWNGYGQLGDNTVTDRNTPVAAQGVTGAIAITVGSYHSCAVLQGGSVKCWGANDQGQLGDGTTTDRHAPTSVTWLGDALEVSSFFKHTCAVRANGTVACWGYNANGRLGTGTTTNSSLPSDVVGVIDAAHVAAGYHHTCATLRSGGARCWGYGAYGQLGHGNIEDRLLASPVQGLP